MWLIKQAKKEEHEGGGRGSNMNTKCNKTGSSVMFYAVLISLIRNLNPLVAKISFYGAEHNGSVKFILFSSVVMWNNK